MSKNCVTKKKKKVVDTGKKEKIPNPSEQNSFHKITKKRWNTSNRTRSHDNELKDSLPAMKMTSKDMRNFSGGD